MSAGGPLSCRALTSARCGRSRRTSSRRLEPEDTASRTEQPKERRVSSRSKATIASSSATSTLTPVRSGPPAPPPPVRMSSSSTEDRTTAGPRLRLPGGTYTFYARRSVLDRTRRHSPAGTSATRGVFTPNPARGRNGDGRKRADARGGAPVILLVAEDEALIALVLGLELRGAGHQVLGPAATPEEALALV